MRRLVWAFAGRTYHIVGNFMSRLNNIFEYYVSNRNSNILIQSKTKTNNLSWCPVMTQVSLDIRPRLMTVFTVCSIWVTQDQTSPCALTALHSFCVGFWFDSLRPINNLSVMLGQVFLGWTSTTKLGYMCLAQGHNAVTPVRLEPAALCLESSTLPLSHCAPVLRWVQANCWLRHTLSYMALRKLPKTHENVTVLTVIRIPFIAPPDKQNATELISNSWGWKND